MTTMPATTPDFTDTDYPADPYPGTRPAGSFVHSGRAGHFVHPDTAMPSGWRWGAQPGHDLDTVLRGMGAVGSAGRIPVLAYGSNVNPSKISWLRDELGLAGPVVVLRAACHGFGAVWSAGVRARDGQRPAVLAALPGVVEQHAVWLATPDQMAVLDVCEGRGARYQLAWVHAPVALPTGETLSTVLAYTARPVGAGRKTPVHLNRAPLLVDGEFVRCRDVGQHEARRLVGVPAGSDGLELTVVDDDQEPVG